MATLKELAQLADGQLTGDPNLEISGVNTIQQATAGQLTFLTSPKYKAYLQNTQASAILGPPDMDIAMPGIKAANPYLALAKIVSFFHPVTHKAIGVHALAVIGKNPRLETPLSIYPFAYLGDDVSVGRDCVIHPGVSIGDRVTIGTGSVIHSQVSIYPDTVIGQRVIIHSGSVIGSDGFGYVQHQGRNLKIPQVGNVVIEDDVEIGANVSIDRGALGSTIIKRGTKIDNLVQIAHNVVIGEDSIIVAQVGIAGSAQLGHHVMLGAQSGVAGHVQVGDGVRLAGRGGITKDAAAGETLGGVLGNTPISKWRRSEAAMRHLPDMLSRIRELEKKVAELEKHDND